MSLIKWCQRNKKTVNNIFVKCSCWVLMSNLYSSLSLSHTLSRIWKTEIKIPNVRAQFPTEQSRVHGKSTNNHHRTNSIKRFFIRSHSHCSGEKNWDKKQKTKRRITRTWCACVHFKLNGRFVYGDSTHHQTTPATQSNNINNFLSSWN